MALSAVRELEAMGSVRSIVRRLRRGRFRGWRGCSNIIERYLRDRGIEAMIGGDLVAWAPDWFPERMPGPVLDFFEAFDAGRWPDLFAD